MANPCTVSRQRRSTEARSRAEPIYPEVAMGGLREYKEAGCRVDEGEGLDDRGRRPDRAAQPGPRPTAVPRELASARQMVFGLQRCRAETQLPSRADFSPGRSTRSFPR